jgi:hypothetical protein
VGLVDPADQAEVAALVQVEDQAADPDQAAALVRAEGQVEDRDRVAASVPAVPDHPAGWHRRVRAIIQRIADRISHSAAAPAAEGIVKDADLIVATVRAPLSTWM